jgi:hypothetical protein
VLDLRPNRVCHRLRLAVLRPARAIAQTPGRRSTPPPARTPLLRLFTWSKGHGPPPVVLPPPMGAGGQAGARATLLRHRRPSPADIGNHRPPSLLGVEGRRRRPTSFPPVSLRVYDERARLNSGSRMSVKWCQIWGELSGRPSEFSRVRRNSFLNFRKFVNLIKMISHAR